jgi:integrase
MARKLERLKALILERQSKRPGLYHDGAGLYLRASTPTARSWVLRYMLDGRAREMGLGSYPAISLSDAREAALAARRLKALGQDPVAVRESERQQKAAEAAKSVTFRYCAEAYIAARKAGWKNKKHADQWTATLETYAYPVMGSLPVQAVDVALVHKILAPIWETKTETASRVRGRIESVLDWAKVRDFRQGDNPARWKGHLENLFPKRSKVQRVEHHPALPYREIGQFMSDLRKDGSLSSQALQFTVLTAARTGEATKAQWEEIDLTAHVWTIPATRMKAGREHRVPLSKPVVRILQALRAEKSGSKYIFPGTSAATSISNMAMLQLLKRIGRNDLTVHGFRSSFRDWAAEQTAFPTEVAEAALAHVVSDKVEAAYRRGDLFEKRRKLMDAWAAYCAVRRPIGNIVSIRRSSR